MTDKAPVRGEVSRLGVTDDGVTTCLIVLAGPALVFPAVLLAVALVVAWGRLAG